MPTGTPYHSYILPYRIRVDDFATPLNQDPSEAPLLHLLTHTHSDHINGLSSKSFGYKVYCSEDAKQMLLRHEVFAERELQALELRAEKIRTYSHLRVDPLLCPDGTMYYTGSRDLLSPLPLNTPTRVELSAEETVVITLLDANHCLGAVMFLIEGSKGAILHTGDFRAEPWFLESLTRNPLLQRYLSPQDQEHVASDAKQPPPYPVSTTLEAIYLDTASTLSTFQIVTKDCATAGLIELMKIFPDSVYFFINCWTWGYEDILKAIAREFQSQIHVDRYKHSIYHHVSDPFLGLITTQDPSSTRFHACERFRRCSFVAVDKSTYPNSTMGKRVIYINPVKMESEKWDLYQKDTKARLVAGEEINNLLVPLSRHSTLPELQSFVKLFRPKRIVPNTLDPRFHGLDWTCIDRMFSHCLHPSAQSSASSSQLRLGVTGHDRLTADAQDDLDVALKNLVGDGAEIAAQRWADHGKLLEKFAIVRDYLGKGEHDALDKFFSTDRSTRLISDSDPSEERTSEDKGKGKVTKAARYYAQESEEDTDFGDSDDERGRTAHKLFASLAGIDEEDKENKWWSSSPSSQAAAQNVGISQELLNADNQRREEPVGNGAWRLNRLTPVVSSPIRALTNKSGSKSCNVTPRQSQLGGSVRKKVTAKDKTSPSTPRTPFQSITRSRGAVVGAGHSLASPICLLSSPPAVSTQGGRQTSEQIKPIAGLFNVTPRQSRLGGSVRKKATAKNRASPSTPRTPTPSQSITRSRGAVVGAGHSLASPICLLSSSPAVSAQGGRQTSEQIKPNAGISHVARTTYPKHHSPNLITKEFKATPATNSMGSAGNMLIRETTIKVCDRQIENTASSSTQHVVLDTSQKRPRKHPTDEGPSFTPVSSKKRRRAASTVDPQPGITLHDINDVVASSSAVSSKEALGSNQKTQILPGESSIPTEREKLTLKRMDIAQQLANNYPHLVAPSYEKKRAKQLAKFKGKERGRAGADAIGTRQKLVQTQTILSFETVDDDDGGMDWNRSKQLADDLRDALANGRRPVLPSLKCAQSP